MNALLWDPLPIYLGFHIVSETFFEQDSLFYNQTSFQFHLHEYNFEYIYHKLYGFLFLMVLINISYNVKSFVLRF